MGCKDDICTCKNTACPRFGKCCECVLFHKTNENNPLPACLRESGDKK